MGMPPLVGLESAPEFFIDGIASIQFLGVNTRYVLFKNAHDKKGMPIRKVEFTVIMPTGCLGAALRQLAAFALQHRVPWDQDGTR